MSINWVMLAPENNPPYTPLPNEQTLCTAPPRIGFTLTTPSSSSNYPATQKQQTPPFNLSHASGTLYLTNRRIIYLPDKPTPQLKSFAAPILNLHDSHVTAPFFGPNVWTALLQPVPGGGIPTPSTGVVEIRLTFKEGGAFDFHTHYERVRERLQQAIEVSRLDASESSGPSRAAVNNLDVSNVNLEDLPAYQEESDGPLLSPVMIPPLVPAPVPVPAELGVRQSQVQRDSGIAVEDDRPQQPKPDEVPAEPPSYEEVQMEGVTAESDRRMSQGQ